MVISGTAANRAYLREHPVRERVVHLAAWRPDPTALIQTGLDLYKTTGARLALGYWSCYPIEAHLASGRLDEGRAATHEALILPESQFDVKDDRAPAPSTCAPRPACPAFSPSKAARARPCPSSPPSIMPTLRDSPPAISRTHAIFSIGFPPCDAHIEQGDTELAIQALKHGLSGGEGRT